MRSLPGNECCWPGPNLLYEVISDSTSVRQTRNIILERKASLATVIGRDQRFAANLSRGDRLGALVEVQLVLKFGEIGASTGLQVPKPGKSNWDPSCSQLTTGTAKDLGATSRPKSELALRTPQSTGSNRTQESGSQVGESDLPSQQLGQTATEVQTGPAVPRRLRSPTS